MLDSVGRNTGTLPLNSPPKPGATSAEPTVTPIPKAADAVSGSVSAGVTDRLAAYAIAAPPPPPPPPESLMDKVSDLASDLWGHVRTYLPFQGSDPAPEPAASPPPKPTDSAGPSPSAAAATPSDSAGTIPPDPVADAQQAAIAAAQAQEAEAERASAARMDPIGAPQRAENAAVPINVEQQAIFAAMSPAQQQAFKELPAADRAAYLHVFNRIGGDWPAAEQGESVKVGIESLKTLLEDHKLERLDFQGNSLLHNVDSHVGVPVDPAMRPADSIGALQSALRQMAFPDKVSQGKNTSTCAAAALQTILASEEPAEYSRIAMGLAFDGKVKLQSGDTVTLDTSEMAKWDDRSLLSAAMQGSLKEYAKRYPAEDDDSLEGGGKGGGGVKQGGGQGGGSVKHGQGKGGGAVKQGGGKGGGGVKQGDGWAVGAIMEGAGAAAGAVKRGGGAGGGSVKRGSGTLSETGQIDAELKDVNNSDGLYDNQIRHMYEDVLGRTAIQVNVDAENSDSTIESMRRATEAGMKIPVGVQGVDDKGNATGHAVTVMGFKKDENGKDAILFSDSGVGFRRILPVEEFKKYLSVAVIPAQFADHQAWNIEPAKEPDVSGQKTLP